MTYSAFRDRLHLAPFQNFILYLADGRTLLVRHHDFAVLLEDWLTVEIYHDLDDVELVDLHHIVSMRDQRAVEVSQPRTP